MSHLDDDTRNPVKEGAAYSDHMNPVFSIIMPTHDRPALLIEAIESVRAQSLTHWELIIIDDGSPSPAIAPKDDRISLVRNEISQGPAAARNRGLDLARGKFIGFLDDDDLWTPGRLANALDGHATSDVVVCESGRVGSTSSSQWQRGRGPAREWILNGTTPQLGATTVRRDMCPSFDTSFRTAEDLDWWLRLSDRTELVHFLAHRDWLWRHHDGARHGIGADRRIVGRKQLMERHSSYFLTHRRARSFAWRRIGLLHLAQGEPVPALSAAFRSLVAYPGIGPLKLTGKALMRLFVPERG